jgi:peptidyl-tRNA hydrolase, PTH1 family
METKNELSAPILAIIGLGNVGTHYRFNRHNIGFMVVDALVNKYGGEWNHNEVKDSAVISSNGRKILVIKPQQFMNKSGCVISWLQKQGIKSENILVVHDELEFPFGKLQIRFGGSARGHNGLRSIIEQCGTEFARLRFGIGRPEHKEMVAAYVLGNFTENAELLRDMIEEAVERLERIFMTDNGA